jgi:ribonuclease R
MNSAQRKQLKRDVVALLKDGAGRPLKPKEIQKELKISTRDYPELQDLLEDMAQDGDLYRVKKGRYAPPEKINVVVGKFLSGRHGGGTVVPETANAEAIFIAAANIESAVHLDRVACRVMSRRSGPLPEGQVIRVLDRARTEIVGTMTVERHMTVVRPEDSKIDREVLIPKDGRHGAADGQLVTVDILDWGSPRKMMVGEVRDILGTPGDPGLDVLIVMREYDLPSDFPNDVEREAARLPSKPDIRNLDERVDLRDRIAMTIDPEDAKDFDDALSVRPVGDGVYEIGIHVADVSHYVQPGTALDDEAYHRGTSVYLVDRVIPMLPEAISNGLCSLVPDEDRFAFSVLARMDLTGRVRSVKFHPSVIRSRRRFAYTEVQDIFDGKRPKKEDKYLVDDLEVLAAISDELIEKRHGRGSLDFDITASRVILDERGNPIDIRRYPRLQAHRLVESFMLLANELVAKRLQNQDWPALYRVHMGPDEATALELAEQLGRFGVKLPIRRGSALGPRALQTALREVSGRPEESVVNTLILRSMKRAMYDPQPQGHFGLGTDHYTHFTSPIRRYPDLIVHRVLRAIVDGTRPPLEDEEQAAQIAEHTSDRERVAEEAERASIELKKVQFMAERIGERFEGRIVSVTAFGFFVELNAYHVSGLVHVNRLEDDYYFFHEENLSLVGEHTARTFSIGDDVEIEVLKADIGRRQIDFELIASQAAKRPERTRSDRGRGGRGGKGNADGRSKPGNRGRRRRKSNNR